MNNKVKATLVAGILSLGILAIGCNQGVPSLGNTGAVSETPPVSSPATSSRSSTSSGKTSGELLLQSQKTQSHEANSVTIQATPKGNLIAGSPDVAFDIVMDTHSVNLDVYDLKPLTVLRDGLGREFRATSWQAPKGGHHRSGVLGFTSPDASGLLQADSHHLELFISNVADVSHSLRWDLRPAS